MCFKKLNDASKHILKQGKNIETEYMNKHKKIMTAEKKRRKQVEQNAKK